MDAVAVSLYKRVWPRAARAWGAESDGQTEGQVAMAIEG
jgi:hypothetical protein